MLSGPGSGTGAGHMYGPGYGYGYGYGYGAVSAKDLGELRGRLRSYRCVILPPWAYLWIGCEVHSVDYWRLHWVRIAKKHDEQFFGSEIEAIFDAAEKALEK